ncbi:MAG TPA: asparaginase, partial [Candidatus Avacidaminococcus intestinavium]|nr:asparaginase [Candidatus Avacidaminococcus intestinavium]
MKKIVVITTGGTIAMKYDSATDGLQPALGGDDLTAAVPALSNIARLEVIEFANVPSGHMTPFMMLELAKLVAKEAERPEVAGFVITHGTDTLEETAYFLSITLATTKPVCITGAMRGASDTGCDGPANLLAAVRTACEEDAINRGVLVVFADEIHLAENVVKSHTTSCHAFTSPDYGAIGHVDVDRITFFGPSVKPAALQTTIVVEPVYLLEIFTGMDEGLFQFMVDNKVAGVVIAAFGCGNVPPAV